LRILKYSIISVLLVILYFLWLEKNYFYNSLNNTNQKNISLNNQIKSLNNKLIQKQNDIKKLKQKEKIAKLKEKNKVEKKVIKIILPKNDIDYSKIIPKEEYNLEENYYNKKINKKDDIKIVPSITLDEQNNVDIIKVNIKTKF